MSLPPFTVIGGYLVFTYAFMQFVFSPVLGNLSDRFGRRPVILLSNLGLGLDSYHSFATETPLDALQDLDAPRIQPGARHCRAVYGGAAGE